jgi:hypothetical protein
MLTTEKGSALFILVALLGLSDPPMLRRGYCLRFSL